MPTPVYDAVAFPAAFAELLPGSDSAAMTADFIAILDRQNGVVAAPVEPPAEDSPKPSETEDPAV